MTTFLRRTLFIGILAVIWEVTSRLSSLPDFMFPSLSQVLQTLYTGIVNGQITMQSEQV